MMMTTMTMIMPMMMTTMLKMTMSAMVTMMLMMPQTPLGTVDDEKTFAWY